ncbi:MAG: drug/metabolite transporter (DMT)-like permease [Cellvibrionaceae bacterium]|jgi:drug/metabolite transporter (DMT)-like permease
MQIAKKAPNQLPTVIEKIIPEAFSPFFSSRVIRFFILISSVLAALLSISYINANTGIALVDSNMSNLLIRYFLVLTIVSGVISWLFVLERESQKIAH